MFFECLLFFCGRGGWLLSALGCPWYRARCEHGGRKLPSVYQPSVLAVVNCHCVVKLWKWVGLFDLSVVLHADQSASWFTGDDLGVHTNTIDEHIYLNKVLSPPSLSLTYYRIGSSRTAVLSGTDAGWLKLNDGNSFRGRKSTPFFRVRPWIFARLVWALTKTWPNGGGLFFRVIFRQSRLFGTFRTH